jgi:hypothetical protein
MNRHLSSEQLSAYLDGEVAFHESREIESHLASCEGCRGRFQSVQRTVSGVWRLDRAAPPPGLSTRVRAEVAAARQPEVTMVQSLAVFFFGLPNRPVLRTATAMGLALVLSVFLFTHGFEQKPGLQEALMVPPVEVVTVEPIGASPLFILPETTSKVAGREFVWTELISGDVWVQRGLEGEVPESRLSAQSPAGQKLLAKYSDLGLLLEDGSRVVLQLPAGDTVELSKGV